VVVSTPFGLSLSKPWCHARTVASPRDNLIESAKG